MDQEQRDKLIATLRWLGAAEDADALEAARAATAQLADLGLDWEDVVVRAAGKGSALDDYDHGAIDFDAEEPSVDAAALDQETIARVLHGLQARPGLADDTREELRDFADQLAAGSLDVQDRAYIMALARRLNSAS